MKNMITDNNVPANNHESGESLALKQAITPSLSLSSIPSNAQGLVLRMFADPTLLEKQECSELVAQLRDCVAQHPEVSELRVLFGMALCVNLEVQPAIEELRMAVSLNPHSFIAHLKLGELWMRLRVCSKAEEHTRQAALLSQNPAQAELARRQAATIRTMLREGIERGGYGTPIQWITRLPRRWLPRRWLPRRWL